MTMVKEYEVWSDTSRRFRHPRLNRAVHGEYAGLGYFTCDCPAGTTSFRPGKPCKHIRAEAEILGISIPASGHFALPVGVER